MSSETAFFERPILNSPYACPRQHWELDADGQPTGKLNDFRRRADFITPIPKPKKQKGKHAQGALPMTDDAGVSTATQQYEIAPIINRVRDHVDRWRALKNPKDWGVTPETERLLLHWRTHEFSNQRPFFCQTEAVETAIWLTEVAPGTKAGTDFLTHVKDASEAANPGLLRIALKLATGAGKTTVMAMLIAWQTLNAVRRPQSRRFTRGFLIVAPGITIRDRLRVLQPQDPDSYYASRELVPQDMLDDLGKAKVVITNYHAFKLRERIELSKGGRALLQGHGEPLDTLETEGQMIQRVMPELMAMKNVMVLNDEAHHCYRTKPDTDDVADLKGDEKNEAEDNNEAARLWITGLEVVQKKLGLNAIFDLSATPFFLSGSGYAEGTLFPWTMSDFSLMDAIECGIVKLPRVPVAENIPGGEMPMYRDLWRHVGKDMPKKGRGKAEGLDPLALPVRLQTALLALYGHYEKTFRLWEERGVGVPPCFIVVCNNTASSKLVYDYISGFLRAQPDGSQDLHNGRLPLFRNFDENGNALARPNTLLIDSQQLESGEGLDDNFRGMAADEIERFRREIIERTGDMHAGDKITDQDLLREVMNTVGKEGRLGASIRCVVSVSMLTEGWDANTVTHVLGVRAFGTQLLCEQVIGRALRRQSYHLNQQGLFNVEYADILGIPFDFTAKPVVAPPQPPPHTERIKAVRPERDHLEIRYPRVVGYRVDLPEERLTAKFTPDSRLRLTPEIVGPSITQNAGIIGETVDLTLDSVRDTRLSTVLFKLTTHLLFTKWRDPDGLPKLHLFGPLKRITKEWMDGYLTCEGDTYPALLVYQQLADMACERITAAIVDSMSDTRPMLAMLDPYNPEGSTHHIGFNTSKTTLWNADAKKCPLNKIVCDSDWEAEFCRVVERHPRVRKYAKIPNGQFSVPYRYGSEQRQYWPDFIVQVEDGHGEDDLLNLVVEIKGYRGEDAKDKRITMETYWVPGVNNLGPRGRWAFAEFTEVYKIQGDFAEKVEQGFEKVLRSVWDGRASHGAVGQLENA
jgi:type III restriction enzyme